MIQFDPQTLGSLASEPPLSKSALTRFLNRARTAVGLTGEVEVLLTSDAELKRLNRAFRNKNKSTDILSFPTPPEISAHHAGDLAISLETAARQASEFGHSLTDELRILILHGLLHLSGLDHETDSGEMAARETELRTTLTLRTTLIARAGKLRRPSDPERREGEQSPHPARIPKELSPRLESPKPAAKRAKGPSHTSLGQRPRYASTAERKRVDGLTHNSPGKPRAAS